MQVKKPVKLSSYWVDILNERISDEYMAHMFYREACNWAENEGYVEAARYFESEASDELLHAQRLQKFLTDHNVKPTLPSISPQENFTGLVDIFNKQYEIERELGIDYKRNAHAAISSGTTEMAVFSLLQSFVVIQDEAEAETSTRLNKLMLIDSNDKNWLYNFQREEFEVN